LDTLINCVVFKIIAICTSFQVNMFSQVSTKHISVNINKIPMQIFLAPSCSQKYLLGLIETHWRGLVETCLNQHPKYKILFATLYCVTSILILVQ